MPEKQSSPGHPVFIKSSMSAQNGNCVELASVDHLIAVRHSAHPEGPILHFTQREWIAFLDGIHNGEFDQLVEAT